MDLYNSDLYLEDVIATAQLDLPWEKLEGHSILLSGSTGLLGSFLVDVLMTKNEKGLNCTVYALGRSEKKAKERFTKWNNNEHFIFIPYDVNKQFEAENLGNIGYVLHLASNTHPVQYATDPIGTIMTNIIGLQNMLELAVKHQAIRFAFASSNEIYGENRGDVELFDEHYCGYIDSNTLRAGYPESKRCGEALCQAYMMQKGIDVVIPRFTRSYGPTMQMSDTKALSQFIKKGIAGENIVLKSGGTQYYSYQYVADSVSGLLTVLLKGKSGEAYNIADQESDIMLKDLARIIADYAGTQVVFEVPGAVEAAGYSKATKARLDGSKVKQLGWNPGYTIKNGVHRTMEVINGIIS